MSHATSIFIVLILAISTSPAQKPEMVRVDAIAFSVPADQAKNLDAKTALAKLLKGKSKIVAQASIRTAVGNRAKVECADVYAPVGKLSRDGDTVKLTKSARRSYVGTAFEIDPAVGKMAGTIDLTGSFEFDVGSDLKVPMQFPELSSGDLKLVVVSPPEGIDAGKKYLVFVRLTIAR